MKKILLVEDEESLINVLELNLEIEDYKVIVAKDGEEAIASFNDSIDLVILDVMLPKVTQYIKTIKAKKTKVRVLKAGIDELKYGFEPGNYLTTFFLGRRKK